MHWSLVSPRSVTGWETLASRFSRQGGSRSSLSPARSTLCPGISIKAKSPIWSENEGLRSWTTRRPLVEFSILPCGAARCTSHGRKASSLRQRIVAATRFGQGRILYAGRTYRLAGSPCTRYGGIERKTRILRAIAISDRCIALKLERERRWLPSCRHQRRTASQARCIRWYQLPVAYR